MANFLPRLFDYARETGIPFVQVDFVADWKGFGLPDLRGFTPHLRQVRVSHQLPQDESGFWLIHDLFHILFYDFVSLHLGEESWGSRERFLESHLASELFAVLGLDYHYLINTPVAGLAIDLKAKDWRAFQHINKSLPAYDSFAFCEALKSLYLEGDVGVLKTTHKNRAYTQWLGHEIRYAEKQRFYTLAWWEDLLELPASRREAVIEASEVHYGIWDLLELLFVLPDKDWRHHTKKAKTLKKQTNCFAGLPKYVSQEPAHSDFRYTGIKSLPLRELIQTVQRAAKPRASELFLFWQVIGAYSPAAFSASELKAIAQLAKSSQTPTVLLAAWKAVQKITLRLLETKKSWKVNAIERSVFFLP